MKILRTLQLILILPLFLFSSMSFGAGTYYKGTVTMGTMYNGDPQMSGRFNVRFNPDVSSGYITMQLASTGSSITVSGVDSTTGADFTCYISSSDTLLFPVARDAIMGGDGMGVFVVRPKNGATCSYFSTTKSSAYIH